MTRNYDTRTGIYPRIDRIEIEYPATGLPVIHYVERQAVLISGETKFLDTTPERHTLQIDPTAAGIPLVHPTTGEVIAGQQVSVQQLMLGMTAVLRADQLRRDAQDTAPAPAA